MSRRRPCTSCGFENAEEGKPCPLCGAVAAEPPAIADDSTAEAVPRVEEALREAGGDTAERNECAHCRKPFLVRYAAGAPGDVREVSVACPHCWQINRVRVSRESAEAELYRVEKA